MEIKPPSEQKADLRRALRQIRGQMKTEEKQEADAILCDALCALPAFASCHILLTFAPMGSEPHILPIARVAWQMGKQVAFPRCGERGSMTFHFVTDESRLQKERYGILTPPADAPTYRGEANALCIVPALGFDRQGYRIGYGGGYYDRFLASFEGVSCGLTYDACLCDTLVREEFDLPVSILITQKEVWHLASKGKEPKSTNAL